MSSCLRLALKLGPTTGEGRGKRLGIAGERVARGNGRGTFANRVRLCLVLL